MRCARRDATPRIGVLGILSAAEQPQFRVAARRTWLAGQNVREAAGGLAVRFVVRGSRHPPPDLLREARSEHDLILIDAPALDRRSGPLVSLLLWLDCALTAWPTATLVGKADDDVWLDLAGVELHLRLTLAAVLNRSHAPHPPLLSWGVMETYSWDTTSQLPRGFAFLYGWDAAAERQRCQRRHSRIGPFHFGPSMAIEHGPYVPGHGTHS